MFRVMSLFIAPFERQISMQEYFKGFHGEYGADCTYFVHRSALFRSYPSLYWASFNPPSDRDTNTMSTTAYENESLVRLSPLLHLDVPEGFIRRVNVAWLRLVAFPVGIYHDCFLSVWVFLKRFPAG